jgi:hypothetical protein
MDEFLRIAASLIEAQSNSSSTVGNTNMLFDIDISRWKSDVALHHIK